MNREDQAERDPTVGERLAQQARETVEQATRVFRSMAEDAWRAGDRGRAVRLEDLAGKAEQRLERGRAPRSGSAEGGAAQATATPTRVLLVDDHDLARAAMRSVLSAKAGFTVVGEAADGETALRLARRLRPDLVLMDLRLPGLDGLAATRALLADLPSARVVVLTSFEQRALVLEALRAGATGYLLKGASRQEVLDAIRGVLAGEARVQGSLAADLLGEEARSADGAGPPLLLTAREVEVLRLLARGRTTTAVSHQLQVSPNTVKTHIRHLLRKLNAADRAEAVAHAAALGLLGDAPPPASAGPSHPIG